MTQDGARVLLKLLSGPNMGAEMELGPGDWLLGGDEESHIFLVDAGVKAQHLLLRVEASGELIVLPKNGSALIDGEPLPPDGATPAPFTIFTVGGTHVAFGPAEAAWPELSLPALVAAPADAAETDGAPTPEDADKVGGEKAGAGSAANKVGGNFPLRRILPFALLCLALVGLIVDYAHFGVFFGDAAREAAVFEKNLQRRGFGSVTVRAGENGVFFVRGVVPGNASMDALVAYVERSGKNAEIAVVSLEDLVAALQAKAKRLDAPLRVTRTGSMLRIGGYVYDMLALEDILFEEREALALVPVRVDVVVWEKAAKELRGMITARNLDTKVRILPDLYRIILQAQPLSAAEQESLRAVFRGAEDVLGVEGALTVERWRAAQPPPRAPAAAKDMALAPTEPNAPPRPVKTVVARAEEPARREPERDAPKKDVDAPAAPVRETKDPPAAAPVRETESPPAAAPVPAEPLDVPGLVTRQGFSCSQLRVVGEGHDMGVIYGGRLYKTGAKMPENLQVKLITPNYVVLQRGKIYTHICTAGETAKETRP